jgi:hypothetical protein
MLSAFTSHLDKDLLYTVTLVGRKDRYNHTIAYPRTGSGISQEVLINEFHILIA